MNDNSNIQNPFISGNKLILPTESESIEILMTNFFKHFKNVYVLVKKNDSALDTKCFMKNINEKTYTELTNNLVIWKCNFNILKNKINFDKTIILSKEKLESVNHFGFKLDDHNLVLPFFTVSFKNMLSYLENKNGESTLENIYNNVLLSRYFKDDLTNIKNKFQFEHLIKSMEESNYWTLPFNCLPNLTPLFKNRKFNTSFIKKLDKDNKSNNEKSNDYLDMIFKNKKHTDVSIIKKNIFKLYHFNEKSLFTKHDINNLFFQIDDKQKYLLFCNLLVSKKYCDLVINNEYVLRMMTECIDTYAPLFRYLIGYAWLRFYCEETIKKNTLKTSDTIVFDIYTASLLPVFPFVHKFPKYNPYSPLLIDDDQLAPEINICGLKETEKKAGICNLDQFRKNLNLFITNNTELDIFNNFDWAKNKMAISGSIMTACIQRNHPLMNLFNETNINDKTKRFYNEYYATSDVDIMFLTQNPLEYMQYISELFNTIVVNTMKSYIYAESSHIKLNPLFQAHIIVKESWITQNIANENLTYDYIYKNLEDPSIKELFRPYFKIELENKIKKTLENLNEEEIKKKYPDYFLNFNKYDIKLHVYNYHDNTKELSDKPFDLKINYKYRINSPHFNHPFELFMAKGDDFMTIVSQFHLPCVRTYYDGYNVFMTPSCISAHMTYMNLDYKYFAGSKDPIEIINKNRMRGFGTWLNKNEIENYVEYSCSVDFWKNMYSKKTDTRGTLPLTHKLFHPRMVNPDFYYDAAPINLENGYANINNVPEITTLEHINTMIQSNKKVDLDMTKFNVINKDGSIAPLQKWVIEAFYEYRNSFSL